MRARLSLTLLPVVFACCLLPAAAQEKPREPFETTYEVIVPGLVGNAPYILEFRSANLRIAVRDLIMGHGEARDVPTRARAVMELRGGSVITTINGVRTRRRQGDIWRVRPEDRLSLENPYDVAVIRAMYILERAR
jgi:hypothetical protein